jgi:membrane-bound metal-dependent hydrolase YbcI (DUF457 family)
MKLLTHVVFGAGMCYAFLSSMLGGPDLLLDAAVAVVLSYAVNYLIEALGHRKRDGWSVRTPLTHSVFTAPVWGAAVAYVVWAVGSVYGLPGGALLYIAAGILVAFSHLFLDSMTERGVFFITERIAISHFGNNNALLNAGFVLLGIVAFLI